MTKKYIERHIISVPLVHETPLLPRIKDENLPYDKAVFN
jgi:hypothetical protein